MPYCKTEVGPAISLPLTPLPAAILPNIHHHPLILSLSKDPLPQLAHTSLTHTEHIYYHLSLKSDEKLKQTRRPKEVTPMKTTHWQTKALTLFIAAAACMSIMTACEYGAGQSECSITGADLEEGEQKQSMTATRTITPEHIHEVRLKHAERFERFPGYIGIAEGHLVNEDYSRDPSRSGIIIVVDEEVDQSSLPVDERIPSCLEGVIVQIVVDIGARVPRGGPITPTTEANHE